MGSKSADMQSAEKRFEFGKNWSEFSEKIDEAKIGEAERQLARFFDPESLEGKSFLDIGCGSGIHSLAAFRLGISKLLAIDLDPLSVETTKKVLSHAGFANAQVRQQSVFDLSAEQSGTFDIVYSWGVLHHTGRMYDAIRSAALMVRSGGLLALALYGKTRYCGMWTKIKRWYVNTTPEKQVRAEKSI